MINEYIKESIDTKQKILNDENIKTKIKEICEVIEQTFPQNKKLLFMGNGGSASDCNHLSTEFVSKFLKERHPLNAISLTTNNALITAISNDFGYEKVFTRQVDALGEENDIVIALSTSGNSINIVEALKIARAKKLTTIGFTGQNPSKMDEFCDILIKVPSTKTSIIQEAHMMIGHLICKIIEDKL